MKTREKKPADSGEEVFTQFGRACQQLGIKIITAHSTKAASNVTTAFTRIVWSRSCAWRSSSSIEAGNQFLQKDYCDQLNERFAVTPRSPVDFHRSPQGYDLASTFCIKQERTLTLDLGGAVRESVLSTAAMPQAQTAKGKVRVCDVTSMVSCTFAIRNVISLTLSYPNSQNEKKLLRRQWGSETVCATSRLSMAQFSIWQRTALGSLSPRLLRNSEGFSK